MALLEKAVRFVDRHFGLLRPFRPARRGFQPFNYRRRETSREVLANDVKYALQVGQYFYEWLADLAPLNGKSILEVGPGINFAPILFLAGHGAVPAIADRFLAPWDPDYHPKFYRLFHGEVQRSHPELDLRPLEAVIDAQGYPPEVLTQDRNSLETLTFSSDSFDIVLSNAVLEHLVDHRQSIKQLYRVTRPGGWGIHQVDFRYHRSFDRPLEHLLLSSQEVEALIAESDREWGTQYRPHELAAFFQESGFDVVESSANLLAPEEYFLDWLNRLRDTPHSCYRDVAADQLRPLGVLYRLQKPASE